MSLSAGLCHFAVQSTKKYLIAICSLLLKYKRNRVRCYIPVKKKRNMMAHRLFYQHVVDFLKFHYKILAEASRILIVSVHPFQFA